MLCRGIRGATAVKENTKDAILSACKELLQNMIEANGVDSSDIAGVWFTTTVDLNAEFPAVAARELGWLNTALLCGHEMDVPGRMPRCLRVLMLVNTNKRNDELAHVYLRGTEVLRDDLNISSPNRTKK
jgi:chorismate mutase